MRSAALRCATSTPRTAKIDALKSPIRRVTGGVWGMGDGWNSRSKERGFHRTAFLKRKAGKRETFQAMGINEPWKRGRG
ncbi:predicted protein [Histoplasma mississippiense (nom. inval.)]|uniref:predicted protein n=1 Tax=Ajellomyces capsulatus (strain NAm1 / WU24) TaxID=2059318 RepID=UPI000157B50F|nr:predicted protein [Histoplasma mississippiense (nom. inval.)]EDN03062.1 predicted protein [Histoplasma mississippiense (nom. inval.)]